MQVTLPSGGCEDVHSRDGEELLIKLSSKYFYPSSNEVELTKNQDGIPVDSFGSQGPYQDDPGKYLTGLLPG